MATGFRTGELERALFYFLAIVLGAGFLGGALGLWSGKVAGRLWEDRHKRLRVDVEEPIDVHGSAAPPHGATGEETQDVALGLTFRAFGVEVDRFLILLRRARPDAPHEIRTATNLGRTWNIGAFDGARLAGAVRILSDGRFFHVAELLVDPDYAARGLEGALRERADTWMLTNGPVP